MRSCQAFSPFWKFVRRLDLSAGGGGGCILWKCTGNYLCWSLFFNKVACFEVVTSLKWRRQQSVFSEILWKFKVTPVVAFQPSLKQEFNLKQMAQLLVKNYRNSRNYNTKVPKQLYQQNELRNTNGQLRHIWTTIST